MMTDESRETPTPTTDGLAFEAFNGAGQVICAEDARTLEHALAAAKAEVERLTKELADERSDKDAILNGYQRMARFVKWVRNDSNDEDGELQVMADGVLKRAENKTPYASYWITEMRQRAESAESALRKEREKVIEECAEVAEGINVNYSGFTGTFYNSNVERALRALKEKP